MRQPCRSAASSRTGRSKPRPLNETSVPRNCSRRSQKAHTSAASSPPGASDLDAREDAASSTSPMTIATGHVEGDREEVGARRLRAMICSRVFWKASSSPMSSWRWKTAFTSALSMRVSMSKIVKRTARDSTHPPAALARRSRAQHLDEADRQRQALLPDRVLGRPPREAARVERGVERRRVGAARVGQEGAAAGPQAAASASGSAPSVARS